MTKFKTAFAHPNNNHAEVQIQERLPRPPPWILTPTFSRDFVNKDAFSHLQ